MIKYFCGEREFDSHNTIGIDATFNLTYADLAIAVVCTLPRTSTAHPVALVVMNKESSPCVEHALKELSEAAKAIGLDDCNPTEAVLDGSGALHAALIKHYGSDGIRCISCYFHVLQRAKTAKSKSRLSKRLWREIKKDLDLMGEACSRTEWLKLRDLFLTKWKEERPTRLSDADQRSVASFLINFGGYLEPSQWRSNWGVYSAETHSPRTNNAVERLNEELKKILLPSRQRLTLADLAALLEDSAKWAMVSQYGREEVRGQATEKVVRAALDHHLRKSYCQLPVDWATCYPGDGVHDRWLFLTDARNAGELLEAGERSLYDVISSDDEPEARRRCECNFTSLREAMELIKTYCIVTVSSKSTTNGDLERDIWCSCRQWALELICPHALCLRYVLGETLSAETLRLWERANCYFDRPKLRRRRDGQLDEHRLPVNVRYGIDNNRKSRAAASNEGSLAESRSVINREDTTLVPEQTLRASPVEEETTKAIPVHVLVQADDIIEGDDHRYVENRADLNDQENGAVSRHRDTLEPEASTDYDSNDHHDLHQTSSSTNEVDRSSLRENTELISSALRRPKRRRRLDYNMLARDGTRRYLD